MRAAAKYSYLVATARHILQRRGAAARLLAMYETDSPQWRDTENALESLTAQCESQGIELIACLYTDLQSDFSRAFHAAYSSSLDRLDVPHHVLAGDLFAPEYRNSIVDGHPNAEGHRLLAEAMYRFLRPHL